MVRGRSCGMRRSLAKKGIERGLYSGFARRIQKLQERADALRPGCFVVLRAFDAFEVQVALQLPALFEEHIAKFFDLLHDARAFARADVEPDSRTRLDGCCPGKSMNDVLVPPDGRCKRGDFSKNARMLAAELKRHETTQRGTADSGVLRAGQRAVFAIDEGLHFFNKEFCIAVGAAAAEFGDMGGSVFANARFGVVHSDDD